ncbi:MAG: 4-hydroxy-3-methylbut-2-enyl diphosphate reductase [Bacteroidota bacterium]
MKNFNIPAFYRSPLTGRIKELRKSGDPRKKDFSPFELSLGPVKFLIARHFGFCYGVENAIEISYKAIEENPGKRIFLLSQMIHNPDVNNDLLSRGVRFIMDTDGQTFIPWEDIKPDDIVITPAFGTTLEIEKKLQDIGVEVQRYNTTCPFVEKVWNRAEKLGTENYTIIIHGKNKHEETRATFSHSRKNAPSVVVRDMEETVLLGKIISGEIPAAQFQELFAGKFSDGFDVNNDLLRIGVINQTTMLATETQAIADHLKNVMLNKYPADDIKLHFADTRDTLCYATNDNQQATYGLLEKEADFAIVIGGYNSSNTTHLVELLEQKFTAFFINGKSCLPEKNTIQHFDIHKKQIKTTKGFLPEKEITTIIITSGASCPDVLVDDVIREFASYYPGVLSPEEAIERLNPIS